jgi:hypothetical protein
MLERQVSLIVEKSKRMIEIKKGDMVWKNIKCLVV